MKTGRKAMTHDDYVARLVEVHGDRFITLSEKRPQIHQMRVLCTWCGNESVVKPFNLLNGSGCKHCAKNTPKTQEIYLKELSERGILHTPLEDYAGANIPIMHRCGKCGGNWPISPNRILRGIGCSGCKRSSKSVTINGEHVRVRGYEHFGLLYLQGKYPNSTIITDQSKEMPNLWYDFSGKSTWTKPDFYIPELDRFFEIKSPGTMGLTCPINGDGYKTFRKLVARMRQMSNYQIILFDKKGNRLVMPRRWYNMKYSEFKREMKARYGNAQ